jgi:hypothetical protein
MDGGGRLEVVWAFYEGTWKWARTAQDSAPKLAQQAVLRIHARRLHLCAVEKLDRSITGFYMARCTGYRIRIEDR